MRLIDADATIKYLLEFRCKDCDRRKGMKNGKIRFCYEIGGVPCRACDIGDTIDYFLDEGTSPTIDAVPVVRCKDCCHWKPPHILLNDRKQRAYKPGDKDNDPFGIGVSCDIGINVGGKCWLDYKTGYGEDKRVFRGENDFCSRADKLPEGITPEQFWGLSEEPTELRDDFDY